MRNREVAEIWTFRAIYAAMFAVMLAPLAIVVSTSFSNAGYIAFPPDELSMRWYGEFASDTEWLRAIENSLIIGVGTMIFSLFLGTTAAFAIQGTNSRWADYVVPIVLLPLLIPAVVIAVALLMFLSRFDLQQSYAGIILAHSLWATPLVFFIMQAVFSRFDWELKDAAMDLGAGPTRTFAEVILPGVKHGIVASALVAFVISFQEFIMALFLSGYATQTIPVLAWVTLRQVLNPLISVVSTLMIAAVIVLLIPASLALGFERLSKQL
ncbi:ABC transporter permease [Halosolutus amylolyticus]|uniref:ABC transporter permease n=1 Tax=Halosolutus amylolyticus TaxID=2932267 RepID=A0ABD5PJI0_9EURY|nr:ABC transporter permease [Halosolutus amylolyticus]